MIYLLISIISSVSLFICFKEFSKHNINTHAAITINYLTAFIMSFIYCNKSISLNQIIESEWLFHALALGILFIIMFNVMAITTQKLGISIGSMASKMSLIIPVIGAYVFNLVTEISTIQIFGILLALLSVYLILKRGKLNSKPISIALVLFCGSGIVDFIINYVQESYLALSSDFPLFIMIVFLVAFLSGIIRNIINNVKFTIKNVLAGLILGIPNYLSIFYVLKSLNELGGVIVFPILNIGIVLISSIISFWIYNEQLSRVNWLGIFIACISIILVLF